MEECFIAKAGGDADWFRIHRAMEKIEEWYVGDGWYSDGPSFAFDYYNSYVIQPMYVECLEMIRQVRGNDSWTVRTYVPETDRNEGANYRYNQALKRMQKFGVILERFISPEAPSPSSAAASPTVWPRRNLWPSWPGANSCPRSCTTVRCVLRLQR